MPQPCDCTARCGDDPWLRDGRAAACPNLAHALAAQQEHARTFEKAKALLGIAQEDGQVVVSLANMEALYRALDADKR